MFTRQSSLFVFLILALNGPVPAEEHKLDNPSIDHPWTRELPPVAPNGAAYFLIENSGEISDRIVSVHSPIADRTEIHTHEMDAGVMKMRRVHSVEVPAQSTVAFEPGGLHVMLLGLKKPLVGGEGFPLTIEFEKAGEIEVTVEIKSK